MQYVHRPPKMAPTTYIAGLSRPDARMSACSVHPTAYPHRNRSSPMVSTRPRISTPPAARATHGGRSNEPFSVGASPQITNAARNTTMISLTLAARRNAMTLRMLAKMVRPPRTAATIVAKLSSARTMSAASRATSVPVWPIAIPTSAWRRAGASFTPSPVAATTAPLRCSADTIRIF